MFWSDAERGIGTSYAQRQFSVSGSSLNPHDSRNPDIPYLDLVQRERLDPINSWAVVHVH